MPKYKLKLEKYTLPDAVKKFYNQEKLSQAKTERDKVRIEIEEIDSKIESIRNDQSKDSKVKAAEIRELKKKKEEYNEKLSSLNKNIYNINAELYDSTVNFNNANISELKANISDISSVVNNSEYLNEKISEKIANILKSNVTLNDIFKTDNFRQMLSNIINEVNEYDKERDEYKNIVKALDEVKDNNSENDNMEIWKGIRDDVKILVPNFKVMISNVTNDINEINDMRDKLIKLMFKEKTVNMDDINDYSFKIILLVGLYNLVEKYLDGKALSPKITDNSNYTNIKIKQEDLFRIVNNLRDWFSKDKNDRKFDTETRRDVLITNLTKENILDGKFVNKIELNHIKEAIDFLNNNVIPNPDKFIQIVKKEETKDKPDNPDNVGQGLDLDEIHQLNIMNNIIQSLNDINETLKGIKDLLRRRQFEDKLLSAASPEDSKQNISKQNISENSPQKLGRFKVEKYKPNMSITEFKKLFDSKP